MRYGLLFFICALSLIGAARAQTPPASPADAPTAQTTPTARPPQASAAAPAAPGASAAVGGAPRSGVVLPPEKANPVRIVRFEKPPVIDGKLDEEVWTKAAVLGDFYQTQPGDNIAPSHPTEVLLGYDERHLYVGFRAHDEPGRVRATVPKRDQVFEDDNVRIILDTFNDKRKAYTFVFNPYGVQADGLLVEGRGEDYSVDVLMESRGVLTADGYTVEVAIPFKSLRYVAGKDKLWGVHAFRRVKRLNNEQNSWMPISRDKSGFLTQQGYITGLEGIATERTLELIPSLTLSETGRRVRTLPRSVVAATPGLQDPGRFINPAVDLDPGLTMKLGITPELTLDLALNPDFAQVEADQLVVTANQRFPIFFEERRPFFLEGIDIFQTDLIPVHTRAIIDPDAAVKLTGKRGRNTFGILLASDNAPGDFTEEERTDPTLRPSFERFIDKNAYIGVVRLKRDIGKENSLGFIATTYNFIERHNHLGGFDGRARLDKQSVLSFQALGTTSRRFFFDPDLGRNLYRTGNGFAYSILYDNTGRNFTRQFFAEGRTRDYRADVGFTERTDTNFQGMLLRYVSTPNPTGLLTSWRAMNFTFLSYDWRARSQAWESEFNFQLDFPHQSYLGVAFEPGYERLFEEEFGRRRTATRTGIFAGADPERSSNKRHYFVFGGSTPSKHYSFNFRGVYRQGHFDFDFGNGPKFPRVSPSALARGQNAQLDPGPGDLLELRAGIIYQPTELLRATLDYTKNRLRRHDNGRVAFDENIFALRATYQFTRFTFARARLDYSTLSARVRGQYLLGWTPNPGTSLYVGYNDDQNIDGFNPFTGQLEPGFRRNGRTFFIKMSYLFRRNM